MGGGKLQSEKIHEPAAARLVFERHHLKGAKEHGFHQLLGHMDLHHPPCLSNEANAFYYGLGALAFNLLKAVKVLLLEDNQQGWSVCLVRSRKPNTPAAGSRFALPPIAPR